MILIIVFIGYYKVYYIEGFKGIKGKIKNRRYFKLSNPNYFIKIFPTCLFWYILDTWDYIIRYVTPKWILDISDSIFLPIFNIIKSFLSLFGYNFNINKKYCYFIE